MRPPAGGTFFSLERSGGVPEQLRLLSAHRKRLLEWVRREERRMDCLDYLAYRLGKKHQAAMQAADSIDKEANEMEIIPVSYTHLTPARRRARD